MKQAKDLVAGAAAQAECSTPPTGSGDPPSLDRTLVARLFARLEAIYGRWWSSRFDDKRAFELAVIEWGRALAPFTAERMGYALEQCRLQYMRPPTLPEFLALCDDKPAAPYHQPAPKALPRPKADKAVVKREIDSMRALLGMRGGNHGSE